MSDITTTHASESMARRFGRTTVSVVSGPVLSVSAEAIVVPANRRGMMVAGPSGHIRLQGGVEIERELMQQAPLTLGTSVATTSGELAEHGTSLILHAIVFDDLGGHTRLDIVENAIAAALESGDRHRVRSIVFPPIGAGVAQGRLPLEEVYTALVDTIAAHLRRFTSRINEITIACADPRDARMVYGLVQDAHTLWWRMKTGG